MTYCSTNAAGSHVRVLGSGLRSKRKLDFARGALRRSVARAGSAGVVGNLDLQGTGDLDLWRTGFEDDLLLERVTLSAK